MNLSAEAPLHLLHRSPVGTLATNLREPQGFPFPTMLPFAPDARHRPLILVSRLAEHTRNLEADDRAGFLVADPAAPDVLAGERLSAVGRFVTISPAPALVQRYLRYHPEAERFLALGDFSFRVMEIERLRYIGGFGTMGWLDGAEFDLFDPLTDEEETALFEYCEQRRSRPTYLEFLGIDRYGIDLKVNDVRHRRSFEAPKASISELERALDGCIESYAK
jgi:putative heme iron utilization protein